MAELNKIEFKYAANGIEKTTYKTVNGTEVGHYIIDASNLSFITHKKKFDFMRLSELYTTEDSYVLNNFALSVSGAKSLYQYVLSSRYDDSTNLLQAIRDTSSYFNSRLNKLISGDAQTSVNKVIDTFTELESFLQNISDTSTLTELLQNIYEYTDSSVRRANQTISDIQSDFSDFQVSNKSALNTINTNIFNISTNINSSINRAINTANSNIAGLDERITTIELGGGTGGGAGVDVDVLKNYVQFKDLTDTNVKTSFVDPRTTESYKLNEILGAFAEPYITNNNPAVILYDNPVNIATMDTSAVIGTVFNRPTITFSGAIKLNNHSDVTPIIEQGTLTATITYRKLKANRIETELKTHVVTRDFTLTTASGISSFNEEITFESMPTLYFGEDEDDNSIVSITTSLKQLKVTYPSKNINITYGIIKGNNNQNILISLNTPEVVTIPETVLFLGTNTQAINFTSFSPAYYIQKENIITNFTQRTGTIFDPAYPVEVTREGDYYYYVLVPSKLTYENLKILYKGTEFGIASTYKLIPTEFTLAPIFVAGIKRNMTLYVAVNEQNKPVKLQIANGGSVKIIL